MLCTHMYVYRHIHGLYVYKSAIKAGFLLFVYVNKVKYINKYVSTHVQYIHNLICVYSLLLITNRTSLFNFIAVGGSEKI